MNQSKKQKLEAAGWRVGSVSDFLKLTPEESAIVELRLTLSKAIKSRRLKRKMTQAEFAASLGTSQSRVNKMEAGDASVSFDLFIKSLVVSGVTVSELSKILASR